MTWTAVELKAAAGWSGTDDGAQWTAVRAAVAAAAAGRHVLDCRSSMPCPVTDQPHQHKVTNTAPDPFKLRVPAEPGEERLRNDLCCVEWDV